MSLLDNLPDKCRIQYNTRTKDAVGGVQDTPVVVQENVSCWLQQASASEIERYAKRGININRKLFFVENPNVTENYEIVVTERSGVACNIKMDVWSEPDPDASAGLGVVWRVMGNEITNEEA